MVLTDVPEDPALGQLMSSLSPEAQVPVGSSLLFRGGGMPFPVLSGARTPLSQGPSPSHGREGASPGLSRPRNKF